MKKGVIIILVIAIIFFAAVLTTDQLNVFENKKKPEVVQGECSITLDDYPVEETYQGEPAEIDFSTEPDARTFFTRITEGAKEGPNFAGKYAVVTWGCGTSCQGSAIVNSKTGTITEYGLVSEYGLEHDLDSRLLILNPPQNIQEPSQLFENLKAHYFLMQNGELSKICERPYLKDQR